MNYRFSELVDTEKIQSLMDSYCRALGIASAIIDLDGTVLVGSNWQSLCTDFHRVNERTCEMCLESDTVLANRLQAGEKAIFYECRNGLIDGATPIVIDGEHLANLFIGQFLVEPPDVEHFRRQAQTYGFEEAAYLEALTQVPIISREKVRGALNFVSEFAVMLAEMGLRQKQQLDHAQRLENEITRRNRIEEELRKLLRAVEQSANSIVITDTEGYIEYVNPKFTETSGYTREEAIGQHTRLLKSGETPSEAYRDLWETITSGQEWQGQFHNKKKNGELYWEFASISPIKDENDRITNFLAVKEDITDRKRSESALQESERRLADIIDFLPDPVFVIDRDGRVLAWNRAMEEMTGATAEEMLGKGNYEYALAFYGERRPLLIDLVFEPHEEIEAKYDYIKRKRDSLVAETLVPLKGGSRYLVGHASALYDSQGNVVGAIETIRDITEEKKVEESLRESEARYSAVVEQSNDGVVIIQEGICLFVNEALAGMLGYKAAEIENTSFVEYVAPESRALVVGRVKARLRGEDVPRVYEARLLRKDGSSFDAELSAGVIEYRGQTADVGVIRDITERKQAEVELQASEDALRTIFNSVHDAIFLHSLDGEIINVNERTLEMYGVDREQALSLSITEDYSSPDNPLDQLPFYWENVVSGEDQLFEWIARRPGDGSFFDAQVFLTRIDLEDRPAVLAAITDVTERKALERQIQESLARREQQVQTSTEVAQEIATAPALDELFHQVVALVQDRFDYYHAHLYILEEESLVMQAGTGEAGRQMKERGHQISLATEQSLVARAARSGEPVLVRDVTQEPDWLPNPLLPETRSEIAVPIKLGNRVLGVLDVQDEEVGSLGEEDQLLLLGLCGQIAVAIDNRQAASERQQVQEALQSSERRFRSLVSNIPGTIYRCALDADWTMEFMTGPIEEMSGYPISDFVGNRVRTYASIIHPEDTALVDQKVQEGVDQKRPFTMEYRIIGADGQIKWVYEGGQAVYSEDGEPLWLDGAIFDITERKQAEAELEARLHEVSALQRLMSREGWQEFQATRSEGAPGYLFDRDALRPMSPEELEYLRGEDEGQAAPSEILPDNQFQRTKPLTISGETIGTMGVYDDPDRPLSPDEQAFFEAVTAQIAEALERARLLEQSQTSLSETEQLYYVSQRLNEASDLQELVAVVAESGLLPHINRIVLFGFEYNKAGEGEAANVLATWYSGQGKTPAKLGTQYLWPIFSKFKLLLSREPNFAADVLEDERIDPASGAMLRRSNARAIAVLPLWSGSRQVGALVLESEQTHQFTDREKRTYTALSRQVAVAVENRRLFEETRQALDTVEATQRRYTLQAWEAYQARQVAKSHEQVREGVSPLNGQFLSEVKQAVAQKRPLATGRPALPAGSTEEAASPDTGASLIVPLAVRDQIIGVLGLQETDERAWTPEEIALVEAVGEQLAQAADQLRLFEETQQQAARERRVGEIGDKIRAAQSLEEALQIAAKEVGLSLKAPQTTVQLDVQ